MINAPRLTISLAEPRQYMHKQLQIIREGWPRGWGTCGKHNGTLKALKINKNNRLAN